MSHINRSTKAGAFLRAAIRPSAVARDARFRLTCLGALLCAGGPAWAQQAEPSVNLPPAVVRAQKNADQSTLTQADLPDARQRIERTPGGAAVVDAAGYSGGRVATLADALGLATGVFVQPRFGAEESRLAVRGSGLQRTFHGRGLKLMQDGVPLNLADGSFDFQAVEALSARYVEVWRGANALRYGAANLGGAINFVSPNGYNSDLARVRVEAGSRGYARAQVSAGNVAGPFDFYVSTSAFAQDGFRRHAQQDTRRNFANLGWQLTPQLETRLYVGNVNSNSELPGSLTLAQLRADPRQANAANELKDQRRDIDWTRVSSKTVWRADAQQQWELFLYASDKKLHHPISLIIDQRNHDRGAELRYVRAGTLDGRRNRFTFGVASSEGRTWEDDYATASGGIYGVRTNKSRQTARNLEIQAENQHAIREDLDLVAGLQAVRAQRNLEDLLVTSSGNESYALNYSHTNPKLGLLYAWQPQVQLFANISGSYEPPTFSELGGGNAPVINRAQRATTLELGSRGRHGWIEWDASFYRSLLHDELLLLSPDPAITKAVNADRTLHQGLELGLGNPAGSGPLEWRLSALWNDFRFRDDASYGNRRLPGVPRVFARGQLGWRLAGGTLLSLQVESASGYAIDFAQTVRAPGYATWGLKAGGEITKGLSWFAEGRNLSDRRHAAATGVVRVVTPSTAAQFLPGDGRAFYAGIDWRFN